MIEYFDTILLLIIFFIVINIKLKLNDMANELANLTTEVSETKGVMQSAKTLIEGFAAKLQEAINANNPAALQALADELDTSANDLAAAITANPLPTDETTPPVEGGL